MSSIIDYPFNFNPLTSPTRKTTSYTVPAGRYALAVLSFYVTRYASSGTLSRGTITVNGVEVLKERAFLFSGSVTLPSFVGELIAGCSTTAGSISTSNSSISITSGNQNKFLYWGGVNGSISSTIGLYGGVVDHATPESVEIWLKEGDVLTGSQNWQAIVTEFGV